MKENTATASCSVVARILSFPLLPWHWAWSEWVEGVRWLVKSIARNPKELVFRILGMFDAALKTSRDSCKLSGRMIVATSHHTVLTLLPFNWR